MLFASCGSYEQATVYRFPRAGDRADVEVVLREPNMGRTSLAIAPSNPDVMYALAASNDDGPGGNYRQGLLAVYRSDRGGDAGIVGGARHQPGPDQAEHAAADQRRPAPASRTATLKAANSITNMGWYNNVIAVDPRDPNRVWAAGVDWFRSDDGGRNWGLAELRRHQASRRTRTSISTRIAFHPSYDGVSNQIGADRQRRRDLSHDQRARGHRHRSPGGLQRTPASSVAWTSLNRGYGVTQFYHGTPFPDGTRYLGGRAGQRHDLRHRRSRADGWRLVFGGDGGFSAVHPTQISTWLVEFQWANLGKTINGGNTVRRDR